MKNESGINPEKLHDRHFDKKKEVSYAHETMEELQAKLKSMNEEIHLKEAFLAGLEKQALAIKGQPENQATLRELEEALENGREDVAEQKAKAEELTEQIEYLFDVHLSHTEALESLDEKSDTIN